MILLPVLVLVTISVLVAWDMVKYSKKIKESERHNNRVLEAIKKKKTKVKSNPKISEDQVSNKRKYKSAKKKAIESKVKKNAGRNKKKV
jgi:Flp pilus assembly protein TadB|tara:strand:- start:921 stop:1187 length:267 start_codon:yes stop_codon:yes gene_type:complete